MKRFGCTYPTGPRPRPPARLIIPHARLTDAQWAALLPHLPPRGVGRPCDLRAQFDAFFRVAATKGAWRELPAEFGHGASVARQFRRFTHAGLWDRLLLALAAAPVGHVLRGLGLIVLARRLNLLRALPGPSWMVADPALSEIIPHLDIRARILRRGRAAREFLRALKHLHTLAGGPAYIPRTLRECWK